MKRSAITLCMCLMATIFYVATAQVITTKTASQPAAANYLVIQVEPSYAIVFIDGQPQTVSDGIATAFLSCGSHRYKVQAPGHALHEGTLEVTPGDPVVKKISLRPEQPNIHISASMPGTSIYIDNVYKGTDNWVGTLIPGSYRIEGRKDGCKTYSESLRIASDEVVSYSIPVLDPECGTIKVEYRPSGARVTVDGVYKGTTPLEIRDVAAGAHKVEISAPDHAPRACQITLAYGQTNTLRGSLEQVKRPTPPPAPAAKPAQASKQESAPTGAKTESKDSKEGKEEKPGKKTVAKRSVQPFTVNGVSFNMILVDGGTFDMGATPDQGSDCEADEEPVRKITLDTYYLGETEVTQDLWAAVMGYNPSAYKGGNLPVEEVSWEDCQDFLARLNQFTGQEFRLPTEAEWEYAARGGKKSRGYRYSGGNDINATAWYLDNASLKTHPVKTKSPNELGIYDMSGNVHEWCIDWYGSYMPDDTTNPTGPGAGSMRVCRGGNKSGGPRSCRVCTREYAAPSSGSYNIGLRLAL